ncbi:MAG: hypothetical protein ACYC1E_03785 [Propionibacteriaceae bacterium]
MAERLVIHGADLQEAYSRIVYLRGEFDSATSRSEDAASHVGHPGLKAELENVAGSWRIHREKLLKSLEDIESQIKGTLDTFGAVDKKMADNLRPEPAVGGQSPTSGGTSQGAPTGGQRQSRTSEVRTQPVPPQSAQASPLAESSTQAAPAGAAVQEPQPSGSGTASGTASSAQGIDPGTYPPELQALVSKLGALVTSPDFIAKYPQFAAGASLGALLPLLLAGGAAAGSAARGTGRSAAGGQQSATDTVRGLLDGVKQDMSDGHLDTMTAAQARAELDRLLGSGEGAPASEGADGSVTPDPSVTDSEPARAGALADSAAADAPTADVPAGRSAGTAGGGSGPAADFHAGNPMLNEDPDALGQAPSSDASGSEAAVPGGGESAPSTPAPPGEVSAGGSSSSASIGQAPVSAVQPGQGTQPATDPRPTAAVGHDSAPMMAPGSMGSVGASGGGTSSTPSQAASSSSSTGGPSSTSSSRNSNEKPAEARKSQETEETRTERKSR